MRKIELISWSALMQLLFLLGTVFLSIFLFQIVFSLLLVGFSNIQVAEVTELTQLPATWSRFMVVFNQIGMFLFPALVFSYFYQKDLSLKLFFVSNKKPSYKLVLIFLIFIPASLFSVDLFEFLNREIMSLLPQTIQDGFEQSKESSFDTLKHVLSGNDGFSVFMQFVAIALLPAIAEELFFRGVLTRLFYQFTFNIHISIVTVALFFAALHFQFHYLLPMWFMGIVLGYVYYWTGSIVFPIMLHFINNAIAIFGAHFLEETTGEGLFYITLTFSLLFPFGVYLMQKFKNPHSLNTWYKY